MSKKKIYGLKLGRFLNRSVKVPLHNICTELAAANPNIIDVGARGGAIKV
jgi:hypothetical protein